jgi:site-specific recombinase XerD
MSTELIINGLREHELPEFIEPVQPAPVLSDMERLVELTVATCASPETRRMYGVQMRKFLATGLPLNREGVALHLQQQREAGKSPATILSAMSAIRKLVEEARVRGLLTPDEAEQIRSLHAGKLHKTRMGTWLTVAQVQQLGSLPDRASYWGKRDACLLACMIGCGLRRTEMATLKWDNYASRDGRMCFVDIMGKGQRRRTLPVPAWAQPDVDAWYSASRNPPDARDRAGNGGSLQGAHLRPRALEYVLGGISSDAIHDIVSWYGRQLGLDIAPHDLRRTLAQMLRKAGAPLEQIQFTLGHSHVGTTVIYLGSKLELEPGLAAVDMIALQPGFAAAPGMMTPATEDAVYSMLERERAAIAADEAVERRRAAKEEKQS